MEVTANSATQTASALENQRKPWRSCVTGEAFLKIRNGDLDFALCGGSDSRLHPGGISAYAMLGALAQGEAPGEVPKVLPFREGRSGFMHGEGAAAFFLMELAAQTGALMNRLEAADFQDHFLGKIKTIAFHSRNGLSEPVVTSVWYAWMAATDASLAMSGGSTTVPTMRPQRPSPNRFSA